MAGETISPSTARKWLLSTQKAEENAAGELHIIGFEDHITLAGLFIAQSGIEHCLADVYTAICREKDRDADVLPHVLDELARTIAAKYANSDTLTITDGFASS